MGEWENGRMGEWGNGGMGERETRSRGNDGQMKIGNLFYLFTFVFCLLSFIFKTEGI
jgi:hypothetical protein